MPPFDEANLRGLIVAGSIGAVSVDTTLFDRYQNNFVSPVLLGLRQFRGTATRFVLSEVVVGEVKSHVVRNAADAKTKLASALKEVTKAWRSQVGEAAVHGLLGMERTPEAFAEQSLAGFAAAVGFEIIAADGLATHAELLRRYFGAAPPFGAKEEKKYEFPDALALLSLEAWAERNNTTMLVVGTDGDWKAFADASNRLICVNDLATALDYFNRESRFVAQRAIGLLQRGDAPEFHADVDSALERFFEGMNPHDFRIHASSDMDYYEIDFLDGAVQHWEVDEGAEPKILRADDDEILFSMTIQAMVNFTGTFSLYVHDSVDRDYVSMGSNTVERGEDIEVALAVRIARRFDHEPEVRDIEVLPPRISIHFGYIDPRWHDEE